ncbi:MAG: ASCH domain-containing protein [Acidobacteriota bacterium]|nr:ASCH domain-containing protein [Acidobacteriota bacterium]
MLLRTAVLKQSKQDDVSLVFRRGRRPTVKTGDTLRPVVGILRLTPVDEVSGSSISADDVPHAEYETPQALRASVANRDGRLYRINVSYAGADPRLTLLEDDAPSEDDLTDGLTTLQLIDTRSRPGLWTKIRLELIARHPRQPAKTLAAALDCEKDCLKPQIRKLKNLGLTVRHERGYSLSPRGQLVLARLASSSD